MPEIRNLTTSLNNLSDDTRKLRTDMADVKRELRKQVVDTRLAISGALLVVIIVAVAALGLTISNRQVAEANKRAIEANNRLWCPLLVRLAPRQGAPPPAGTPEQVQYALETRRLLKELAINHGCDE